MFDIERLSEKFQLSASEKNVLVYINTHRNDKNLNIRKVAQQTYCSPTFIVSMCKKMVFSGYSELIYYLIAAKNLTFSLAEHDTILEYGILFNRLLKKHRKNLFMILSEGMSSHIANYMSDYLNLNGFRAIATSHLELLRPDQIETTFLWIVSNSGETKRIVELTTTAHKNKQDILAFVGNPDSSLAKLTNLTISSNTNSHYSYQKYYPQLFFGLSLNTFELLMSNFLFNERSF